MSGNVINFPRNTVLITLVNKAREKRREIDEIFADVEHWNSAHPSEEPINADEDGELRRTAVMLDVLIAQNEGKR